MLTRAQLSTLLLVAGFVWGVSLIIQGTTVTLDLAKPFSLVVGVVTAVLSAFNLWCWKWRLFRGWLVKRPVIEGTWDATIQSTWRNPETKEVRGPIRGYMAIRQTFTELHMKLMTEESYSVLQSAEMVENPDGSSAVVGVYRNEPDIAVRARSPIHYGGFRLGIEGASASRLRGTYWTDRQTAGDISLDRKRKRVYSDFRSAARRG